MARGSGEHLEVSGILYGDDGGGRPRVNMLATSLNSKTVSEINRLISRIEEGDPSETLKLLNLYKDRWNLPALERLATALARQCVMERYPALTSEGDTLLVKELTTSALTGMKTTAASETLTRQDFEELFFEAAAFLHAADDSDGGFSRELRQRVFARLVDNFTEDHQDRWLDQGLLPLLADASRKGTAEGIEPGFEPTVDILMQIALCGGGKAMEPWSDGSKRWIATEEYIYRFYRALYDSDAGIDLDQRSPQAQAAAFSQFDQRLLDHDVDYAQDEHQIQGAAWKYLEQRLHGTIPSSVRELDELARRSLAEACVDQTINYLRNRSYAEVIDAFNPPDTCAAETHQDWEKLVQHPPEHFPEEAVRAGAKAYHLLDEYASWQERPPRERMAMAFVTALTSG